MGSSNPISIDNEAIAVSTTFSGGESSEFDLTGNDSATLLFDVNAGSGTSAIVYKFQSMPDESDLYRKGDDGFELEEIEIPLTASTNNQKHSIRIDSRAIKDARVVARTVGGTGQINSIKIIIDGSATLTPAG